MLVGSDTLYCTGSSWNGTKPRCVYTVQYTTYTKQTKPNTTPAWQEKRAKVNASNVIEVWNDLIELVISNSGRLNAYFFLISTQFILLIL